VQAAVNARPLLGYSENMPHPIPILFSWSGGKDSALALHALLQQPKEWEVVALLTSVADEYRRVSHHGVREELLVAQAESIGLPLDMLRLPAGMGPCTNSQYEALVGDKLAGYAARRVMHVGHGDIFLEDLRAYREKNLAKLGMTGVFPIWKRDTKELVATFVDLGFRATLCCVEGSKLDDSFVGRELNLDTIADLPPGIDPCGENGEYHSFVSDGPIFQWPVEFEIGIKVCRDNRHYIDLVPTANAHEKLQSAAALPPV
jgi:uncharacterized protein (TIGR00290 family)